MWKAQGFSISFLTRLLPSSLSSFPHLRDTVFVFFLLLRFPALLNMVSLISSSLSPSSLYSGLSCFFSFRFIIFSSMFYLCFVSFSACESHLYGSSYVNGAVISFPSYCYCACSFGSVEIRLFNAVCRVACVIVWLLSTLSQLLGVKLHKLSKVAMRVELCLD